MLTDVTDPKAVLKAIAEYDRIGQAEFLEKYGFKPSQTYWLQHEGRLYVSKAIIGAAHGYQHPEPLRYNDFSGGHNTVVKQFKTMGFAVVSTKQIAQNVDPNFDPSKLADEREKTRKLIKLRQGQGTFRAGLLRAYEGRCSMSGETMPQVLEAAHIVPYLGPKFNRVSNGLLLRSDLHTLFDLGHLSVEADSLTIMIGPGIKGTTYEAFQGKEIERPQALSDQPNRQALLLHNAKVFLKT